MNIIYDGIIYKLQSSGGVSVYFNEIISRAKLLEKSVLLCDSNSIPDEFSDISVKFTSRFLERYRDVKCNIDGIFHSSYYRLPYNRKLKVITTVHDFTYEKYVSGPAKWVHTWQKNRAIKNSDLVICVSQNTANDLMQYCPIDSSKIRVIHNGVSSSYFSIPELQSSNSNNVIFVGARNGYKNFGYAIKSIAHIPHLNLHIVGGGILNKNEKQLLDKYLPNRYKWLGRLSDQELNIAYNSAYALLYPSSYEGFGIPILEAMRAGCPVIAVNISSIPEVAGDAAILVNSPSIDSFVEALKNIPLLREELIQKGFNQVNKFSWERCFEETLSVYNELSND
ncbi:glycosyltransferase family 4 protein [Providencia rettgeri]|nr:glycosyltransferase family 4 protein [Providencia rettgeri]ELS4585863.1 glycosyltransferase family 4 protein [Providencia rettgeri]